MRSRSSLFVSAVTFAEIRFGIELVAEGSQARRPLHDWFQQQLRPMFESRVLPVSEDVMFKWRLLVETGRKAGHFQPDHIIAATALHHGLTVVTRDGGFMAPMCRCSTRGGSQHEPTSIKARLPVSCDIGDAQLDTS